MKFYLFSFSCLLFLFSCGGSSENAQNSDTITPPVAQKQEHIFHEHGNKRFDNYFWMRLTDEQKNAEIPDEQTQDVLDYLNAENDYLKNLILQERYEFRDVQDLDKHSQ